MIFSEMKKKSVKELIKWVEYDGERGVNVDFVLSEIQNRHQTRFTWAITIMSAIVMICTIVNLAIYLWPKK